MSTPEASAEVCIARESAEACKHSIERFEALEREARRIRGQRDEAVGARDECRMLYQDERAASVAWEIRAREAQLALDDAPSQWAWMGAGAGGAVVVGVLVFVLTR